MKTKSELLKIIEKTVQLLSATDLDDSVQLKVNSYLIAASLEMSRALLILSGIDESEIL